MSILAEISIIHMYAEYAFSRILGRLIQYRLLYLNFILSVTCAHIDKDKDIDIDHGAFVTPLNLL